MCSGLRIELGSFVCRSCRHLCSRCCELRRPGGCLCSRCGRDLRPHLCRSCRFVRSRFGELRSGGLRCDGWRDGSELRCSLVLCTGCCGSRCSRRSGRPGSRPGCLI